MDVNLWLNALNITLKPVDFKLIIEFILFLLLLTTSALISGSEVAIFSLQPSDTDKLKKSQNKNEKLILKLLENPDKVLATILITNNFVNIGIVILSTYISANLLDFNNNETFRFIFEAIFITFIIVLFGEIIPKVYAKKFNLKFCKLMAKPLVILQKIFAPLSAVLIKFSGVIQKFETSDKISIKDLVEAINITEKALSEEENKMLKSIIRIHDLEVREIMKSRVDVFTLECSETFDDVKKKIVEMSYSRIPVYRENLDNVIGVLYVKDLIAFLKEKNLNWCDKIRKPYFVPENKKVHILLKEFREKKIHMAIVSDEYGGFSGIVTLEDILEEIVGDIKDEFDIDENIEYQQISDNVFVFDGKILLNDFYRITKINEKTFDKVTEDVETLAGVILATTEEFPDEGTVIDEYPGVKLIVQTVNDRRIEKIKVIISPQSNENS